MPRSLTRPMTLTSNHGYKDTLKAMPDNIFHRRAPAHLLPPPSIASCPGAARCGRLPRIEMNPKDAERLGLKQGDWVWIETPWGKVREVLDLYHGIPRGVVNANHAWWFPEWIPPPWLRAGGHQRGERPLRPGHRRRLRRCAAFHPDHRSTRPRPRIPRSAIRFRCDPNGVEWSMMLDPRTARECAWEWRAPRFEGDNREGA